MNVTHAWIMDGLDDAGRQRIDAILDAHERDYARTPGDPSAPPIADPGIGTAMGLMDGLDLA